MGALKRNWIELNLNSSIKDILESKRFESFESRGKYLFFKLPTILKTLVHSKY